MDGYDSSKLTGMMEKVTAGATASLGKIKMNGYDAGDLWDDGEGHRRGDCSTRQHRDGWVLCDNSSMVEKVTAGATAAMGDIQMDVSAQSYLDG